MKPFENKDKNRWYNEDSYLSYDLKNMNKIKKINTVFNNNNQTTKKLISKVYENCLNKDNKNKNKNKKGIKYLEKI